MDITREDLNDLLNLRHHRRLTNADRFIMDRFHRLFREQITTLDDEAHLINLRLEDIRSERAALSNS
jgi:hypothetical protein